MARVHLFNSTTYNNDKRSRHSPSLADQDYQNITEDVSSPNINENRVIEEGTHAASKSVSPVLVKQGDNFVSTPPSPDTNSADTNNLTSRITTSSAALTAALLQNAHSNSNMAGAVAAAFSVEPESFQSQQSQTLQQENEDQASNQNSNNNRPEDAMDQAAAATALQLLGLSTQSEIQDSQDKNQDKKDSIMTMEHYTGLKVSDNNNSVISASSSAVEDIDLASDDMIQDYKRGTWTREEDELLLAGIKKYGYGRWKEIAASIPGRKGKQLKQRWDNTLAAKYVDQEWLRNKIKHDEELQKQHQLRQLEASPSSSILEKTDDKSALKFLETTDWNDIALKITEKAREGDQHAIEALLSQALLGTVSANQHNDTTATNTSTSNGMTSAVTTEGHSAISSPAMQQAIRHESTPTTPTTVHAPVADLHLNFDSSTITSSHDASATSTPTIATANTNPTGQLSLADAAALALYAQQLSHNDNNNTAANTNQLLANHPYFLTNPFGNGSDANNNSLTAIAAAAVANAVAHHQTNNGYSNASSPVPPTSGANGSAVGANGAIISGQKRRRSDPALADTQSAAMTIYASATPITTTVNNQTQTVYPCLFPNCGKTFARLYNLKSHSRTHTDDRPFICPSCTAAFSRNHDLKRHSKIHQGDKPYTCLGCKKSFSRLDALKRHKSNQRNKQSCVEET